MSPSGVATTQNPIDRRSLLGVVVAMMYLSCHFRSPAYSTRQNLPCSENPGKAPSRNPAIVQEAPQANEESNLKPGSFPAGILAFALAATMTVVVRCREVNGPLRPPPTDQSQGARNQHTHRMAQLEDHETTLPPFAAKVLRGYRRQTFTSKTCTAVDMLRRSPS